MVKAKILIINSCSKSKAVSHSNQPTCLDLITKEQREEQKKKFLNQLTPASQLYTGQQAKAINRAIKLLRSNHEVDYYIISAGFGFVKENELLPPYECTFSNLKKSDIQKLSQNLEIVSSIEKIISNSYNLIYLALSKDYITSIGSLQFLASKTSLLVHFVKELKNPNQKPCYLVEDSTIVTNLSKSKVKVFPKPLGALIASKGTILENYAMEISKNNQTCVEYSFTKWIEEKVEQINLITPIQKRNHSLL